MIFTKRMQSVFAFLVCIVLMISLMPAKASAEESPYRFDEDSEKCFDEVTLGEKQPLIAFEADDAINVQLAAEAIVGRSEVYFSREAVQGALNIAKEGIGKYDNASTIALSVLAIPAGARTAVSVPMADVMRKENVVQYFSIKVDGVICTSWPMATLKDLAPQGDIELVVEKQDDLYSSLKLSMYTISDGKKQDISNRSQIPITVRLPYTLNNDEDISDIGVIFIDEQEHCHWLSSACYEPENHAVAFTTNRSGKFALAIKTDPLVEAVSEVIEKPMTDVSSKDWYYSSVQHMIDRGFMQGVTATQFNPMGQTSRGMFVTILGRMSGIDPTAYQGSQFSDVDKDAYYAAYVAWAAKQGIIKGISAKDFAPDQALTREQMATLMVRFAQNQGLSLKETTVLKAFADEKSVALWALPSVQSLQRAGLMSGDERGDFSPRQYATRAEVASVMDRFATATAL